MASLSYRSAAKIAAREMRSSRGKFLFVLLSVAIGVAALTGVRLRELPFAPERVRGALGA